MIQDSGKRESFDTGAVRDIQTGKGRCDLLPLKEVLRYLKWVIYGIEDDERMGVLWWLDEAIRFGDDTKLTNEWLTLTELIFHAVFEFSEEAGWDPYDMIFEMSIHFEEGANKYGERNWEKGIPVSRYFSSAIRHYLKFERGDEDERHDRAVVWNLFCALWTIGNKRYMNDLPGFKWRMFSEDENPELEVKNSFVGEDCHLNLDALDEFLRRNGFKTEKDNEEAMKKSAEVDLIKKEHSMEELQEMFAELRKNKTYGQSESEEAEDKKPRWCIKEDPINGTRSLIWD